MPIHVNAHLFINRSTAQVFACLTDIENWSQWDAHLVSMEQISAGSLQVGSQIRQVTKSGRKPVESMIEVTDYVADQRFGIGGPNLKGTFTLEPFEDGTRLDAQFEVVAAGLMALMYKLMLKQFVMNDLRRFKKMVELTETALRGEGRIT